MTEGFDEHGSERRADLEGGVSLAWVWSQYKPALPTDEGRRPFAPAAGGAMLGANDRTKRGLILGGAVLAGLLSLWLSALLLAIAVCLIAWGQEPEQTEEFARALPFGDHLLKALGQLDAMLASRTSEQ